MDLIKYVGWENVLAVERRKHAEIVTARTGSDKRPPMRKTRKNSEEEGGPSGTWARRSQMEEKEALRRDKGKQQATRGTQVEVRVTAARAVGNK
jgi:hypothetical protein